MSLSLLQEALGSGRLRGLESLHVTAFPWEMVSLLAAMALHPALVHLRELTLDVQKVFGLDRGTKTQRSLQLHGYREGALGGGPEGEGGRAGALHGN